MLVNSSIPYRESSRPMPLSLTPPNGIRGSDTTMLLTVTIPAAICRATFSARRMSLLHTLEPSPNSLMNIFKHAKFTRGILTRWGWHKKELGFRDWYNDQVIGFFLQTAPTNYELALRALRVINDPYRPNEFAVTGFREVIYPKMEKARKDFEQLTGSSPPLPEIPVLAT